MAIELTADELAIVDEISHLGAHLWKVSLATEGLNTDPKMFSIMLFKRLWSHHRGFVALWNTGLYLEGDIILRAGLEAAICIAANFVMREKFIDTLKQDAAFTVQKQIRSLREQGEADAASQGEKQLDMLLGWLPEGAKPAKLDWSQLAKVGGVPQLYDSHRHLSGVSAHVTGLSVLNGVTTGELTDQLNAELAALTKKIHLMTMAGATLHGAYLHAGMLNDVDAAQWADALVQRLNGLSQAWSGVRPQA